MRRTGTRGMIKKWLTVNSMVAVVVEKYINDTTALPDVHL